MFQVVNFGTPGERRVLFQGSFAECQKTMNELKSNGESFCTVEHPDDAEECTPTLGEIIGAKCREIGDELTEWHYASTVKAFAAMIRSVVDGWPEDMQDEFFTQLAESNTPSCLVVTVEHSTAEAV